MSVDQSSLARGKELYRQECAACHGLTGKGDGAKVKELNVTPSELSNPTLRRQSDGTLFWKISEGKPPMPPFRLRFSEKERWMIVNFLRTLSLRPTGRMPAETGAAEMGAQKTTQAQSSTTPSQAPPQTAAQSNAGPAAASYVARAKELYVRECADCHGPEGKGDGPRASELKVNPTDLSSPAVQQQSDRVLMSKIIEGKKPMPAFKTKLQGKELSMVISYLRTLGMHKTDVTPVRPSLPQDPTNSPESRAISKRAYLHVLVNPMPIYGLPLAALALLVGLLMRNRPMQSLALGLIFVCSAFAWLAYLLGHQAYHEVYLMSDSEGQRWLAFHMHRADQAIYFFYALAAMALAAALVPRRIPKIRLPLALLTFALTLICMASGAWIAKAGGKVRHREFRAHAFSEPAADETGHHGTEKLLRGSPDSDRKAGGWSKVEPRE